jgi:hypothetical protein
MWCGYSRVSQFLGDFKHRLLGCWEACETVLSSHIFLSPPLSEVWCDTTYAVPRVLTTAFTPDVWLAKYSPKRFGLFLYAASPASRFIAPPIDKNTLINRSIG